MSLREYLDCWGAGMTWRGDEGACLLAYLATVLEHRAAADDGASGPDYVGA